MNYLTPVIGFFPNSRKWSVIHTLCCLSELCRCFPGRGDRRARGRDPADVGREPAGGAEPHRGVHDLQPAHCPGNASCSWKEPVSACTHVVPPWQEQAGPWHCSSYQNNCQCLGWLHAERHVERST